MSCRQLNKEERYQIYVLLNAEHNQRKLADLLKCSRSTISRKLKRNSGLISYRSAQAQRFSDTRRTAAHKEVTDEEVQAVMNRLNDRPRKTRGCRSPNELLMGQRADLLAAYRNCSYYLKPRSIISALSRSKLTISDRHSYKGFIFFEKMMV
ncbi:helix-turn-helix domain-containing protein [Microbulbifer sp. 2201CG32-9]|uniref:helix-turn-helix domain-containing protein n=1 Tax=Microbulbifer sp. 2201CG32-9 TaxID=3232309 RepID=UPI00345B5664